MERMANKGSEPVGRVALKDLAETSAMRAAGNDPMPGDRPVYLLRHDTERVSVNARLLHDDGILIVSASGRLETQDFDRLRLLVDPYIREYADLKGLLLDLKAFPDWEALIGMFSHIRFQHSGEKTIARVAAVSDNPAPALVPVFGDYFTTAEVRHFARRDRDQAMSWLHSGRQIQ
jgi:hypothetical protein